MKASDNPFFFRELSPTDPFCDREKELKELTSYARGNANVVIFSPRRYGKTSLVRRVQKNLSDKGAITIFADLFGVTSVEDVAMRIAKSVFEVTRAKESLFQAAIRAIKSFRPVLKPNESGAISLSVEPSTAKKGGFDVLDETMTSLAKFIIDSSHLVNIALDEFQEIAELQDDLKIEGMMRSYIQTFKASCFFVGSRRRILLAMFNDKRRPFFQSAINFELKVLPHDDLVEFISGMFRHAGRNCPAKASELISSLVHGHPYYSQKLSFFACELSGKNVEAENVKEAYDVMVNSEKVLFEAILQGLAPKQIAMLKAVAREPSKSIFSIDYMKRHDLGSTGGAQGALKRLTALDVIEQDSEKCWKVVDPVFCSWLKR